METITCRAVIEVLGKPQEHVENSLKSHVDKIKNDDKYEVISLEVAEIKKQEKAEMWANFAEIEFKTKTNGDVIGFCFDYMPSLIEVLEPNKIGLSSTELSHMLNDMQARFHQVDMVAKSLNMKVKILEKNSAALLKNYILILLAKNNLNLSQLSKFTGVAEAQMGDYLDKLIDQKKISLDGEVYSLVKKD